MLLDEPFAGVDPISIADIQQIVTYLSNRGIGILITDHNVRDTLGICDRAYIVNEGAIVAKGNPEVVLGDERGPGGVPGSEFQALTGRSAPGVSHLPASACQASRIPGSGPGASASSRLIQ